MNLHAGNVLISGDSNTVVLCDHEEFFFGLNHRNLNLMKYVFIKCDPGIEARDKESEVLCDLFKPEVNIFEKIDIISFGRFIYEMYTGKELNASYPDELELAEIDNQDFKVLLQKIFPKDIESNYSSLGIQLNLPEVTIKDLIACSFFNEQRYWGKANSFSIVGNTKSPGMVNSSQPKSKNPYFDLLEDKDLALEFEQYSEVKNEMYNQAQYLKEQLKKINSAKQ